MKDRFHGFITEGLKLRKESSNRVAFDHIIGTSLSREFCQLWFTLANFQQPFYQNSKSRLLYVLAYELVYIMYLSATFNVALCQPSGLHLQPTERGNQLHAYCISDEVFHRHQKEEE